MIPRTKKQLIAGLLFISCAIGAWLLFITPAKVEKQLRSFSQADSLLQLTLSDFNINRNQISSRPIRVDSSFKRVTYSVAVPPDFSKTQFHSVLQNRLASYRISLPARVLFPEKDMHIYFDYNGTIIRTVQLKTDKNLSMRRSFASIIVAFNERPPAELLQTLKSMGEPIPLAIIMQPPFTAPDWWNKLKQQYNRVFIWPKSTDNSNLLSGIKKISPSLLKRMHGDFSNAALLSFYDDQNSVPQEGVHLFSIVDVHSARIFNAQMDASTFRQTFRQWVGQSRQGKRPIAIIMGTETAVNWLQDELNTFRKGGLSIIAPPTDSF